MLLNHKFFLSALQLRVLWNRSDGLYVCVGFGVAGLIAQVLKVQTAVTLWRLSLVERVGLVVPRSVCFCCQSGGGASILLLH